MKKLILLLLSLFAFNVLAAPVNINTADAKTISDALLGIGQQKAEAIVKYRTEKGLFKTAEDLTSVGDIPVVEPAAVVVEPAAVVVEPSKDKKAK
jgi:competence protein ComEA